MTTRVVTDEQLGVLARRQNDLFRRVREGTLPVERVLGELQSLIEGQFDALPQGINRLIDCTTRVVTDEQFGILARRQNDLFRRVREGTLPVERVLGGLQSLIEGAFDAIPQGLRRLIDCDASPWCPNNWKVEAHQKGGQLEFDPAKIELYLSKSQQGQMSIEGHKLRKELKSKQVMNACVLDHLLANTNLIPESWKQDEQGRTLYIYFWGTVYRLFSGEIRACIKGKIYHSSGVHPCVRSLYWGGGKWDWYVSLLDHHWGDQRPAAVSAS